jgi:hypothetical protein
MSEWQRVFLDEMRETFLMQKKLADAAVRQVPAELLFSAAGDGNSIAALLKHVGGNLRSRWEDPFTTDGEKPDRRRDDEFIVEHDTVDSLGAAWERGWETLSATLAALEPSDLERPVTVRGEVLSLTRSLHRSLAHTAQHAGQVVLLARQLTGPAWQTLSIPRGESERYRTQPPPGT